MTKEDKSKQIALERHYYRVLLSFIMVLVTQQLHFAKRHFITLGSHLSTLIETKQDKPYPIISNANSGNSISLFLLSECQWLAFYGEPNSFLIYIYGDSFLFNAI